MNTAQVLSLICGGFLLIVVGFFAASLLAAASRKRSHVNENKKHSSDLYLEPMGTHESNPFNKDKVCKWKYDRYQECWDTECGQAFTYWEGSPKDNDAIYCQYCGKKINQLKESDG